MELSILLMEQIAKLFLMIFMGYAIVTFMLGEKWVFYACVFMGLQTFFSGHIAKMYSATRKDSIQKKFFPTLILLP